MRLVPNSNKEVLERVFQGLLKVLDIVFIILDIVQKIKATFELFALSKVAIESLLYLNF